MHFALRQFYSLASRLFAERDTRRLCVCCSLGNRYFLCFVMGFILLVSACTVLATWSAAAKNKNMFMLHWFDRK